MMRLKLADAFLYLVIIYFLLFLITMTVTIVQPTVHIARVFENALTYFEDDLKIIEDTVKRRDALRVAEEGVRNVKNFVNAVVDHQSLTHNSLTATVNPPYCGNIINKQTEKAKQKTVVSVRPPWIDLINSDVNNGSSIAIATTIAGLSSNITDHHQSKLYVQLSAAHTRRLGNQLFNYASLFGIAWRNKRIPIWFDGKTHIRSAFNIRIPIDQNNTVLQVSSRFLSHFILNTGYFLVFQ